MSEIIEYGREFADRFGGFANFGFARSPEPAAVDLVTISSSRPRYLPKYRAILPNMPLMFQQ
jgi:hypothetical protein